MLLTISTTHQPATDLGYLLHKHPAKAQKFKLRFGQVHIFYPEATVERCTMAFLLEVDPVRLTWRPAGAGSFALQPYVNDRPYVASSLFSVAISEVLGTALNGRCKDRPALVEQPIPLTATLAALPVRGGASFLRALFEPLGYAISVKQAGLDEQFPEWGLSRYFTVTLTATVRLAALLSHLYVLIPVLDDEKHYYVDEAEIAKLLRRGDGWLEGHPAREQITHRYLGRLRSLTRQALAQLSSDEDDPDEARAVQDAEEAAVEKPLRLHTLRLETVAAVIEASGARRALDLGCGEGRLLRLLLKNSNLVQITGMDISLRALDRAAGRLRLETMPARRRERLELIQGSLLYKDERLRDYDVAALVEVIEHLDPPRLTAFEQVIFGHARPGQVIITTPNREYNVKFGSLPAGTLRHRDHRFEWSRAEFEGWATAVAERYGYQVRFQPIGPLDEMVGAPSQMAVFVRGSVAGQA